MTDRLHLVFGRMGCPTKVGKRGTFRLPDQEADWLRGNTRGVIHEMIIDNQQPCVKKKSITFSIIGKKLVLLQFETKTLWTHPSYH